MDIEIYRVLIQYGGGVAIIVALIFLFKELNNLLKSKNNNHINERIAELDERLTNSLEKLETNDLYHAQLQINELRGEVDGIRKDLKIITNKVIQIETILKMKNLM